MKQSYLTGLLERFLHGATSPRARLGPWTSGTRPATCPGPPHLPRPRKPPSRPKYGSKCSPGCGPGRCPGPRRRFAGPPPRLWRWAWGVDLRVQLGRGQLAGTVSGHQQIPLAFCRLHLGEIKVQVAQGSSSNGASLVCASAPPGGRQLTPWRCKQRCRAERLKFRIASWSA